MKNSKIDTDKWFNRRRILLTVLFVAILLLGSAFYWFSVHNKILKQDYENQIKTVLQQNKFDDLFLNIQKGSSALRGYAATKNVNFIKNYEVIIDSINSNYTTLKLLQQGPDSKIEPLLFTEFDRMIREKLEFMHQIKQLSEQGKFETAINLISTEKGDKLNDSIFALKDKTNLTLRTSQQLSQSIFTDLNKRNNNLAYLGIIASMLFIIIVVYFLLKEIVRVNKISDELRLQKNFMRVTLSSIADGLITTGKDSNIIYMNPSAEKLTGWTNTEVKNKPLHTVYKIQNEETGLPIDNIVSRIIHEGKTVELENNTVLNARNRDPLIISNNGSPLLDLEGNLLGAVLVFNDITEKKKIQDELKNKERQLRNLIESISEAVYTCDENGFIQIYNKAAVKLWGREPVAGKEQWSGSWKLMTTDGVILSPELSPMATAIKEGRTVHGKEILIQRQDGSIRYVLPSPTPLFNSSGKLTGAVNMLFDVTDKKEREVLIKSTEEKYRDLFDQASDAIVTYTFDGVIHEFNDIICEISGYSKAEFEKLKITDILVGELIISTEKYNAILSGQSVTLYRQFQRKDGVILDLEIKTKLLHDGKILGIGRDVTERNKIEEKIRKSNERFEILSKATSDTIWDWDMISDKMLYNEGNKKMFGYENTEIVDVAAWWQKNIHPADRDQLLKILDEVHEKQEHLIQLEYRFLCADGTYKYILDRGFVIYNEDGKPIRMIGAMQDISKEKDHENQITAAILETQEKERRELGMELHDNVNQLLGATLLYLGMAEKNSLAGKEVSGTLSECISYITEAINDIRNLSHRLTPYTKEDVSLKEVLEWLTGSLQKTNLFKITTEIEEIENADVSSEIQTNLYRIIQTQLTNIVKHAEATNVEIKIELSKQYLTLLIKDDGKGFNTKSIKRGIGLLNIKRRAELFSGNYTLTSSPGNGCELKVEIPLSQL